MSIEVIHPGMFSTIQDAGRHGLQHKGLSPAGAMDYKSFMLGNLMLENDNPVSIEMTMQGGVFKFNSDVAFIITGADMNADINGDAISNQIVYNAKAGEVLTFKQVNNGYRTYLTVKNGFDIETIKGSYATHTKIGIGGLNGRTLQADNIIPLKDPKTMPTKRINTFEIDKMDHIRFIPGKQYHRFKDVHVIPNYAYEISNTSDRMGIRLTGERIDVKHGHDIISEPIPLGSIQVSTDGQPIILMNDRQTVGGYVKLGTVYFADLPKLAQKAPGSEIHLVEGTLEEAIAEKEEMINRLNEVSNRAYDIRHTSRRIEQLLKRTV